ncbi:hypothetical protein Plec18167_000660 [Paecilomyces lecythidis]|uniref:Uncharacterized protein n=1 Tax=Paecilomyces lecythidis TaxID=3004212 RepID=A0ABR3YEK8_9EURO
MAPNLYLCLRTLFCPQYWFQRGERIRGAITVDEHWSSPVPGTYRYIPGRGWHLIHRDDATCDEKSPQPTVYCRIIHRYLLESEMQERCRWHTVTRTEGGKPEQFLFFLLDDGFTWVAGWDHKGRFIPGPYRKWCFDKESMKMRRMKTCESAPTSRSVSRRNSLVAME